nr:putative integron gene cassette protein [uncultured bacterium]
MRAGRLLSSGQLSGFGRHALRTIQPARCLFGMLRPARSHVAWVSLAGFGNSDGHRFVSAATDSLLRTPPAASSLARPGSRASVFGKLATALPSPASRPA